MGIPCQNGDIILVFEEPVHNMEDVNKKSNSIEHIMVMGRLETNDGYHFLHASGEVQTSDNTTSATPPQVRSLSGVRASNVSTVLNDEDEAEGIFVMMRITDPIVLKNFVQVTSDYAKRVDPKQIRTKAEVKHQQDAPSSAYLSTPLNIGDRNPTIDSPDELAIYRNIRAYLRYQEKDKNGAPTPMSKNWGVKCSQFVLYSYIIAQMIKVFPDGLPDNINQLMQKIDIKRNEIKNATENFAQSKKELNGLLLELSFSFKTALKHQGEEKTIPLLSADVKEISLGKLCNDYLLNDKDAPTHLPVELKGTLSPALTIEALPDSPKPVPGKQV